MSVFCGACKLVCNDEKSEIVCSVCDETFHIKCVKSELDAKKTVTRSASNWKCKTCRTTSAGSSMKSSDSTTVLTKEFLRSMLEEFKSEMFNELKSFKREMDSELKSVKREMAEVSASIQFLSNTVEKSNEIMNEIKKENAVLKRENEEIRLSSARLSNTVVELQDRVRTLEQYTRMNNLEISGIPVTPRESIRDLIKDVAASIGVAVEDSHINAAHRVPSFRRDKASSIVVQFHSRSTKDLWIEKYRLKKTLLASEVNATFPGGKVYVSEHLSPANKQFLSKLKFKCREIGYRFAWHRDGKFYVRRAEGEKCLRIDNYEDINKLK